MEKEEYRLGEGMMYAGQAGLVHRTSWVCTLNATGLYVEHADVF